MQDFDPWAEDPNETGRYANPYTPPPEAPATSPYPFGIPPNGGNRAGYMDISYWNSRGVPTEQIFDVNTGQLKPGWTRTENGYEQQGPSGATTAPQTDPNVNYGRDPQTIVPTGGSGSYQAPERRTLGSLSLPGFNGPTMAAPKPFAYQDYQLPTTEEIGAEPGFDFALKQGLKAYENSQAYLGTYKTGGTIKGLNDYARGAATQNADRVIGRSMENYDRNRNNAADTYATNYGISRDVFDRNYTAAKDQYAPKAREAELNFARDWDQYAYEGDDDYRRWKAVIDANTP